jgi:hypothetical protein
MISQRSFMEVNISQITGYLPSVVCYRLQALCKEARIRGMRQV